MILAAGKGERLRPLTESVPKALVEVRGETLLQRHLRAVRQAGIDTVVINLGWLGEQIVDRVGSGGAYGLNVVYSPEGDNILETGGGIHRALPMLGDAPFLVINADIYTDMSLPAAILPPNDLGRLVLVPTPAYRQQGDFALAGDRIANDGNALLTFSGVAVYRPEFFAGCAPGRFPLAPMLRDAAAAGRLGGMVYDGFWRDVGTPERLRELNA
jgi:MurNAc alpha-1-phosphate uridylyltransferase